MVVLVIYLTLNGDGQFISAVSTLAVEDGISYFDRSLPRRLIERQHSPHFHRHRGLRLEQVRDGRKK